MKLSNATKETIRFFLEEDLAYDDLVFQKEEMRIPVELCPNYTRTLILQNTSHNLPEHYDFVTFMEGTFSEEENYYVLTGRALRLEEYEEIPFSLLFHNADVEIQVFRADEIKYNDTPWIHLYYIASEILDKTFLPGDHLNKAEKELLPLIVELSRLSFFAKIPEEHQSSGFPKMKSFLEKHRAEKALSLLTELENAADEKKRFKLTEKIHETLNEKEHEALWRELYGLITDTQKGYPSRTSVQITPEDLGGKRKEIQTFFEQQGYSGTYPDFMKEGTIPGFHLDESYNMSYFITNEKHAVFHIHCTEFVLDDSFRIEFLCGTELLRKNEIPGDIFSCLFDRKGRSFYHVSTYIDADEEVPLTYKDLSAALTVAVKKAEMKKLTQEEMRDNPDFHPHLLFLFVLIVMGGLFAIFWTLGMIIFTGILTLILGGPSLVLELLFDKVWLYAFFLSWIGFGGIMGIITVIASRKK